MPDSNLDYRTLMENSPENSPAEDPVAQNHTKSVAEIAREHNRALHAFLMARVGDEHEAREVAQEAYVRMLQIDRPGAISYLRAYLFRIAANIAIDRARERSNRARLLHAQFATFADAVDELSPDRHVLSGEDLRTLQGALDELSEKPRRAFMLCHVKGFSDEYIGRELGISARMVRRYLAEASLYCRRGTKTDPGCGGESDPPGWAESLVQICG
jgi:RNA polymerase sigma-70 factor (ECF subfamily)